MKVSFKDSWWEGCVYYRAHCLRGQWQAGALSFEPGATERFEPHLCHLSSVLGKRGAHGSYSQLNISRNRWLSDWEWGQAGCAHGRRAADNKPGGGVAPGASACAFVMWADASEVNDVFCHHYLLSKASHSSWQIHHQKGFIKCFEFVLKSTITPWTKLCSGVQCVALLKRNN